MQRGPGRRGHRRLFRNSIWVVAAVVLLPAGAFAAAQGEERLVFLDEAPVEFDLSLPPGARQTVEVANGDTQALDRLELRVLGLPGGVLVVQEPERTGLQPSAPTGPPGQQYQPSASPGGAVDAEPAPEVRPAGGRSRRGWRAPVAAVLVLGVTAVVYLAVASPLQVERSQVTFQRPQLHPSATQLNVGGAIVLAALGIPIALTVRRRMRRRDDQRLRGEDEGSLQRALDRRDAVFAALSAFLVILSGMSLVYATDPTFGTPGDYLTILLWGTALTEGLALARNLLPSPFG